DAALAVLVLGLAEALVGPGLKGSRRSILIDGNGIELIGDNGEAELVGAVEVAEDFEERAAERGVAGGIGGEWRGEVGAAAVVSRCAEGFPGWVTFSNEIRILRAKAGGAGAGIVLADG